MYSSLHRPQIMQKENVNSHRLSNIFHSIQAAHKGNWKRKKKFSEPIENVKTHKLRSLKIKTCGKKRSISIKPKCSNSISNFERLPCGHSPLPRQRLTYG